MAKSRMERSLSIDFIKVIAIIGVITIHSCVGGFSYPINSWNWNTSLFFGVITRASVPLFLMCSGALLLDPLRELGIKRLFSKNILRVLAALLFWAAVYQLYHLLMGNGLSLPNALQAVKEILLFKHEGHLYYLHIILLVYACLPITRLLVKHADQKTLEYALLLWFVLGILFPTVKVFWPVSLLVGIPLQWMMNMTYASIGYGVLGYYMKKYPLPRPRAYILCGGAGFLFTFVGTWWMSLKSGSLYQHFLEGMSLGVFFLALGIYGTCMMLAERKPFSAKTTALLTYGSKASFCMFLVHMLFLNLFSQYGLTVKILPCILSIPLLVGLNVVCSGLVYWILSHSPILRNWVI